MFHPIPTAIRERMTYLEKRDAEDRQDGTPRLQRMRQIPPDVGKFIALLSANTPTGAWIEIGTSAGYSALWLALACLQTGRKLTTFEVLPDKARLARETLAAAGVEPVVDLVMGDALRHLSNYKDIAFCFLDAEKEIYLDCYEAVVPALVSGGLLVADNAINHRETLAPMLERANADERVDTLIVPIGKGVLVSRRNGAVH